MSNKMNTSELRSNDTAAVGGGLNGRVVDAALPPGVTESMVIAAQDAQQTFYDTHSMSQYGDSHEYTMNAVACGLVAAFTPAAPVGGFVVVPREPTEAMLSAAIDAAYEPGDQDGCADFGLAYAAMIAASPAAQSSAKDGVRVGVPGYGGVPIAFDDPELLQW